MKVSVRLYAVARQLAARDRLDVELPEGATLGQLRAALAHQLPELAPVLPHVMFAVDTTYARDDQRLSPNAQVACIPPVSGG